MTPAFLFPTYSTFSALGIPKLLWDGVCIKAEMSLATQVPAISRRTCAGWRASFRTLALLGTGRLQVWSPPILLNSPGFRRPTGKTTFRDRTAASGSWTQVIYAAFIAKFTCIFYVFLMRIRKGSQDNEALAKPVKIKKNVQLYLNKEGHINAHKHVHRHSKSRAHESPNTVEVL